MGFSPSRTYFHRSSDGSSTPSFEAAETELMATAGALREATKRGLTHSVNTDGPAAGLRPRHRALVTFASSGSISRPQATLRGNYDVVIM